RRHVIGAYHVNVARQLAAALGRLHTGRACVVHSSEGLDEIGLEDETKVFDVDETGTISEYTVTAESFGLNTSAREALAGGNAHENVSIALDILSGKGGPQRDVVIANAAMAIHVAGKASSLADGAEAAARSIDAGKAKEKLQQLIFMTSSQ
ncbi:MAG: anthranilate phosphoribosyltransferase, partial [Bacteroidota bacterium]